MTILADHTLLLALPALAPALVVVGVVLFIALRDRRSGTSSDPDPDPEESDENSW